MDTATWHLLRRQHGRCPLCRGLLLQADHQPQGPEEWQQWHTATRTAARKHAIAAVTDLGVVDGMLQRASISAATGAGRGDADPGFACDRVH